MAAESAFQVVTKRNCFWHNAIDEWAYKFFFAFWPDDKTRKALSLLQTRVRGRLTRYQNLHLTLAFIGPQPHATLPVLRSLISELDDTPIHLEIDRLGYFKRNRIAWAGTHDTPTALMNVQQQLVMLLKQHKIRFDRKEFKPHITLARHAEPPTDLPFEPCIWQVGQIVLAQSPLPSEPPSYKMLAIKRLRVNS